MFAWFFNVKTAWSCHASTQFFLNLYDWFVKNKSVMNFGGFRTKSVLSCCDAKGFIQSSSQTSYSPLSIGPVRLTYFQSMFYLWWNYLINLHQRNMQKHTHVEKWHIKDMWVINLNLKHHISTGVFSTIYWFLQNRDVGCNYVKK